jgi:F1F0 ATPase subunit 2
MILNAALTLALTWLAGMTLGGIFFGGLWWTVRKALASSLPGIWFLGSLLLRMGVVLAGFYFVAGRHAERAATCGVGFAMARWAVTRRTRLPSETSQPCSMQEDSHAH